MVLTIKFDNMIINMNTKELIQDIQVQYYSGKIIKEKAIEMLVPLLTAFNEKSMAMATKARKRPMLLKLHEVLGEKT